MGEAGKEMVGAAKDAASDVVKSSGMADMLGKAKDALASVEGGPEMLKNVSDAFSKITEAIKGVTDKDSAAAALPKLNGLADSFGGMTDMFGKLPDGAKTAVAGVFTSAIAELKPLLEKVMALPGVEAVIKPAIDALMEKLAAFKV
jgi:hypothetical protein